jgi:hypothetical protein
MTTHYPRTIATTMAIVAFVAFFSLFAFITGAHAGSGLVGGTVLSERCIKEMSEPGMTDERLTPYCRDEAQRWSDDVKKSINDPKWRQKMEDTVKQAMQPDDNDIAVQNSAIVQLGADLCGYRINQSHREAMNYIFKRNESRFDYLYNYVRAKIEKQPLKFCDDLRTDYLAKMYESASMMQRECVVVNSAEFCRK